MASGQTYIVYARILFKQQPQYSKENRQWKQKQQGIACRDFSLMTFWLFSVDDRLKNDDGIKQSFNNLHTFWEHLIFWQEHSCILWGPDCKDFVGNCPASYLILSLNHQGFSKSSFIKYSELNCQKTLDQYQNHKKVISDDFPYHVIFFQLLWKLESGNNKPSCIFSIIQSIHTDNPQNIGPSDWYLVEF